jgi:hypothetical protein
MGRSYFATFLNDPKFTTAWKLGQEDSVNERQTTNKRDIFRWKLQNNPIDLNRNPDNIEVLVPVVQDVSRHRNHQRNDLGCKFRKCATPT